jgi:hypothetical protein
MSPPNGSRFSRRHRHERQPSKTTFGFRSWGGSAGRRCWAAAHNRQLLTKWISMRRRSVDQYGRTLTLAPNCASSLQGFHSLRSRLYFELATAFLLCRAACVLATIAAQCAASRTLRWVGPLSRKFYGQNCYHSKD